MKRTAYEVVYGETLKELQDKVDARINESHAILEGGVTTVAVVLPSYDVFGNANLQQAFYQALTYEVEVEND